jgi:predicted ester cyclase
VARVTGTGTHTGELMGVPPTGKRLEMTGIVIYRIAGGKIVERWAQHDVLGLMQQLGVIPTRGHES